MKPPQMFVFIPHMGAQQRHPCFELGVSKDMVNRGWHSVCSGKGLLAMTRAPK